MTAGVQFSSDLAPLVWSDAVAQKTIYGPKGALLLTVPRAWTPSFAVVPAAFLFRSGMRAKPRSVLSKSLLSRIRSLVGPDGLIVRSSVIGETIWDRGSYKSPIITDASRDFEFKLQNAIDQALKSARGKQTGLVLQRYVKSRSRGEFGNLLRVSKTRDHWELSTVESDGPTSRKRFNTQRDEAAPTETALEITSGVAQERLFGSIAAWLNSYLLRGRSQRLNCEWITDNKQVYLVQIDEEDEDLGGVNPYQLSIYAAHQPAAAGGEYLRHAAGKALRTWDKLKVLDELWEPDAKHRPMLFFVPMDRLAVQATSRARKGLVADFRSLIGPNNIVVRTSVRSGRKPPNLPRTECVNPEEAAAWCISQMKTFKKSKQPLDDLAFIAHRFIAARASAWARAEPDSAIVEIHSLWGLPDALQYCPYDIWEVHVGAEVATDYPEFKSNMLIAKDDGGWEYVRIKNDLGRNLSIGRRDAIDIAKRTAAIARRIGRACHVMWFVGCVDQQGIHFNMPWYWNDAHDAMKNVDRTNYRVTTISNPKELESFVQRSGSRWRQAIELKPTDRNLMRNEAFIDSVGAAAHMAGVPVILAGSTLAHAYYQLRRQGCTVVTPGEKDHSRVRQNTTFGKLVRDKVPARIAERRETGVTRTIPNELLRGFLIGKLLEEALEVRSAKSTGEKTIELADIFEVVRALARVEGISFDDVRAKADEKKEAAGGFEKGLVLLQTGILGRGRRTMHDAERPYAQVLARKTSSQSYEIPFSFFGFMELDQPRSLAFDGAGVRVVVELKGDRIEMRVFREAEQLEFPLDLAVGSDDAEDAESIGSGGTPKIPRVRR